MSEPKMGCGEACVMVPLIPLQMTTTALLDGWAVSTLWGWFIVPAFGLPAVTIAQGAGISLIAAVIGIWPPVDYAEKPMTVWERQRDSFVRTAVGVPLVVGIGWIVKTVFA